MCRGLYPACSLNRFVQQCSTQRFVQRLRRVQRSVQCSVQRVLCSVPRVQRLQAYAVRCAELIPCAVKRSVPRMRRLQAYAVLCACRALTVRCAALCAALCVARCAPLLGSDLFCMCGVRWSLERSVLDVQWSAQRSVQRSVRAFLGYLLHTCFVCFHHRVFTFFFW